MAASGPVSQPAQRLARTHHRPQNTGVLQRRYGRVVAAGTVDATAGVR